MGCGNSGAEIALDLHEHGARPWLVIRAPIHVTPRDLYGRPAQETSLLLSRLPLRVADRIALTLLKVVVGDLSRYGIHRPEKGPIRMVVEHGRVSMLDIGTLALIKQGLVQVVPGVASLSEGRVTFVDGRTLPFDAIVLATGFRPGLAGFLDGAAQLTTERGTPKVFGEAAAPGLYFIGFKNPPTGALREMALEAPRIARHIAARR
jgi:cation diffusion facilitator CzcD-associated flavoprotein CzcO